MSFPWKKLKKTSICQLVKEHIRSHRNGGSPLIVETGFPTSLVDLFVKNRQRLIKPSKKKVAKSTLSSPSSLSTLHLPFPMTPTSPASYTINKGSQLKGCQGKGERFDVDEDIDTNRLLISLLKIFLVVVLVLGAKNLLMGITMSAFLLFFLEYSGECLYRWLMPCAAAKRRILLAVEWVWRFIGGKMIELEEEEKGDCVFKAQLKQKELAYLPCSSMAIQCVKEKTYESSRDRKLDEGMDTKGKEEELMRTELLESKKKKSHKSNMKSKMKKFLSNKLRKKITSMIVK